MGEPFWEKGFSHTLSKNSLTRITKVKSKATDRQRVDRIKTTLLVRRVSVVPANLR